MSPPKKRKPVDELTYEQAFKELEEIVLELEGDEMPLEESLTLFERGQELTRRCGELLEDADLKIQQVMKDGATSEFEPGED